MNYFQCFKPRKILHRSLIQSVTISKQLPPSCFEILCQLLNFLWLRFLISSSWKSLKIITSPKKIPIPSYSPASCAGYFKRNVTQNCKFAGKKNQKLNTASAIGNTAPASNVNVPFSYQWMLLVSGCCRLLSVA